MGVEADLGSLGFTSTAELFGEGASTVVISATEKDLAQVSQIFSGRGIDCRPIGRVTSEPILRLLPVIEADVRDLRTTYEGALPGRLASND